MPRGPWPCLSSPWEMKLSQPDVSRIQKIYATAILDRKLSQMQLRSAYAM